MALRAVLVLLSSISAAAQEPATTRLDTVYVLDLLEVVCPAGRGLTEVTLNSPKGYKRRMPHIPVFFRTDPEPLTISFRVMDAEGKAVVVATDVELAYLGNVSEAPPPPPTRRLEDLSGDEATLDSDTAASGPAQQWDDGACDDVFLLDGRAAVSLPDTWEEARANFRSLCEEDDGTVEVCEEEEVVVFQGYPSGSEDFQAHPALCSRLTSRFAGLGGDGDGILVGALRRLKGTGYYGGPSGNQRADRGFRVTRAGPGTTSVGYTRTGLAGAYPRGYASTSYGYGGYGSYPRFYIFPLYWGMGMGGHGRGHGHYNREQGRECTEAAPCEYAPQPDVQLYRDDLVDKSFLPGNFTYPLTLTVHKVEGAALAKETICPPSDVVPATTADPTAQGLAGTQLEAQGLDRVVTEPPPLLLPATTSTGQPVAGQAPLFFFALSQVESFEYHEEGASGGGYFLIGALVIFCCVCPFAWYFIRLMAQSCRRGGRPRPTHSPQAFRGIVQPEGTMVGSGSDPRPIDVDAVEIDVHGNDVQKGHQQDVVVGRVVQQSPAKPQRANSCFSAGGLCKASFGS